jgi:hypothetical protein
MTRFLPSLRVNRRLRHDDYIRWTMGALASAGVLVNGFGLLSILAGPHGLQRLPFVSPGAPFGTYAQDTQLGILTLAAGFALLFVGAALAFRSQRMAARTLIAGGVVHLFLLRIQQLDTTQPHDNGFIVFPILFVLAPFALASLLLVISRRGAVRPGACGSVGGV